MTSSKHGIQYFFVWDFKSDQKWLYWHLTQKLMELDRFLQNICDIIRDITVLYQSYTYSNSFWAKSVSHRKRQWTNVWISPSLLIDVVGDRGMTLCFAIELKDYVWSSYVCVFSERLMIIRLKAIWYFYAICRIDSQTRTDFQQIYSHSENNDQVQIVPNHYLSKTESVT